MQYFRLHVEDQALEIPLILYLWGLRNNLMFFPRKWNEGETNFFHLFLFTLRQIEA